MNQTSTPLVHVTTTDRTPPTPGDDLAGHLARPTANPATWTLTPTADAEAHDRYRAWRATWATCHDFTTHVTASRLEKALHRAGIDTTLTNGWVDQAALTRAAWHVNHELILATPHEQQAASRLDALAKHCRTHGHGATFTHD